MDRIFVMKDGQISEQGNYHELLAAGGEFADFLVQYLTDEQENGSEEEENIENLKQSLQKVMGKEKLQRQMSKALSQRSQRTKSQRYELEWICVYKTLNFPTFLPAKEPVIRVVWYSKKNGNSPGWIQKSVKQKPQLHLPKRKARIWSKMKKRPLEESN